MQLSTHADIASRAYSIWEQEGRPQGRDVAHWLQAERELAEGGGQSRTSGGVATAKAGRAQGRTAKAGTAKTAKPKKASAASRKPKK